MIEMEDWRGSDWDTLAKKCNFLEVIIGIKRVGNMIQVNLISEAGNIFALAPTQAQAVDAVFQRYMETSSCPSA